MKTIRINIALLIIVSFFAISSARSQWVGTNPLTTTSKVGIQVSSGISNPLEVAGATLIGSGFAGTSTTGPTNGLSVQGWTGIGTISPLALLNLYSLSTNGDQTVFRLQSATNTQGFGKGQIEFWSNAHSDPNEWRPGLIYSTDFGGYRGGLAFAINGNGSLQKTNIIEKMRIVNEGVGINTSTPSQALDIVGNLKFSQALMPNNDPGSTGKILVSQGASTAPLWSDPNGIAWLLKGNSSTDTTVNFLGTTDNHAIMFRTEDTIRGAFLKEGNFRIGDVSTTGTRVPANQYPPYENGILFSGSVLETGYDKDNSDPLWIARVNYGVDKSELRVMIGDNAATTPHDDFISMGGGEAVGTAFEQVPAVRIEGGGSTGFGTIPAYNTTPRIPPASWTPGNRVDILRGNTAGLPGPADVIPLNSSGQPVLTPSNVSGLRLADLAGATPAASNGMVLSINPATGDVILRYCCTAAEQHDGGDADGETIATLSAKISELEAEIKNLKYAVSTTSSTLPIAIEPNGENQSIQFFQNDPNPFSESTSISYFLPMNIMQAALVVTDQLGHNVYTQLIDGRGNGSLTVGASMLRSGTYLYSIVADGMHYAAKKMTVIK